MNLWKYYNNKSNQLKYPDLNNHSHEIEIAKTNSKWAFEYVSKHGKDEDLEPAIAKSVKYSYFYAKNILRGPFKLGEKAIATRDSLALQYAKWVKGPFKLGEPIFAKTAFFAFEYASVVLKGPFKLGEKAIAKSDHRSFAYAKEILKGPFKLGEPIIAKDEYYSKEYTQEVLKKDFYLGGKLICKYEG